MVYQLLSLIDQLLNKVKKIKCNNTELHKLRVQNHWVVPRWTQPFILPWSIKWLAEISGNLVVKSKLPPRSGCSLETSEPHP